MWYPQRIPQGPTSGEVFANSRKDATLVAKNWLPLAVPLSNPPLPQPSRSLPPTPLQSTFTSPAKHHQDLKNESEQTTQQQKNPAKPKCSGANFQCSRTHNTYPSLSLCAKYLRARQQALGNGDGARTSTAIAKVATRSCVRTRHVGEGTARERDDGICLT